MPWFKIYAGLGGGFNSVTYVDTIVGDISDLTEDQQTEVEDWAEDLYEDEIESWVSYYIKPATGPDDKDEEE